jgi:hypothetical protein
LSISFFIPSNISVPFNPAKPPLAAPYTAADTPFPAMKLPIASAEANPADTAKEGVIQ